MTSLAEQFTLEKIIVPIGVAVVTTLVVEYFAKPRLEARKARLMRDRAQFDSIIFDFQRIGASLGALPTEQQVRRNKVYRRFRNIMLSEAKEGLYSLMRNMSKLSTIYVVNHKNHISKTMLFVGYLLSQVELAAEATPGFSTDKLKEAAENLELFDTYYVVYVYMYDSQESWWRRLFWRVASEKKNDGKIDALLEQLDLGKDKND